MSSFRDSVAIVARLRQRINTRVELRVAEEKQKKYDALVDKYKKKYDGKGTIRKITFATVYGGYHGQFNVTTVDGKKISEEIEQEISLITRANSQSFACYKEGEKLLSDLDKIEIKIALKDPTHQQMLLDIMEKAEKL
jgi:hypothetical protein